MAGGSKSGIAVLCATCCVLPVVIAITIVCTLIPIYFLIVGILKIDECENDPRIPIWMIVIASLMLLERLFGLIVDFKDRRFVTSNPKPNLGEEGNETEKEWEKRKMSNRPFGVAILTILVRIAVSVTTIIGIFWIFGGLYNNHKQCSGYIYYPVFIFCLFAAIAAVIGLLTLGCVCCCTALIGVVLVNSGEDDNANETSSP